MTGREQGLLLLTSSLGDPARKPMTLLKFRTLILRVKRQPGLENARQPTMADMAAMGYDGKTAENILSLFGERERLEGYLRFARRAGCQPVTLASEDYPVLLSERLGIDCPSVLWAKGDLSLLRKPAVALVGSRELAVYNQRFARAVGRWAAERGFTLVSGNARGADREAQTACLAHGGSVISVVADSLTDKAAAKGVLYLSEDSFDLPFSAWRALRRNRIIHGLGAKTFVAQSDLEKGGTWDGTAKNLLHGWSPVFCCDDGSPACRALSARGAVAISPEELDTL